MTYRRTPEIATGCLALCVAALVFLGVDAASQSRMALPLPNANQGTEWAKCLKSTSPEELRNLAKTIANPGDESFTWGQHFLSGLSNYVSQWGTEAERRTVAAVLIDTLRSVENKESKAFLISQIQQAGKDEAVAPLSVFLTDDRLCDPAARALVAIGTPDAVAALAKALPSVDGAKRVTMIQALGELRSSAALNEIMKYAVSEDRNTRDVALYALANSGDPAAGDVLAKAAETTRTRFERAEATSLYLRYAKRLAENGKKTECETICRALMKTRTDPKEINVRCAALSALVATDGKRALGDLLVAMDSDNRGYRGAALMLASAVPGRSATGQWVKKLGPAPPEVRAEILCMLGDRGDKAALSAVLNALKDADKTVRSSAIAASTRLGGAKSLSSLLAALKDAREPDEIKTLREALLRLPGEKVAKAVAAAMPQNSPAARKALLEILAARRAKAQIDPVFAQTKDADESVRVAAVEALGNLAGENDLPRLIRLLLAAQSDAERAAAEKVVTSTAVRIPGPQNRADLILAALAETGGVQKASLLHTLSGIGGAKALEVVVADTKSADVVLQNAAVRALSDWPDAGAAPELLSLAKTAKDDTQHVLALRGYIRLAGIADVSAPDKIRMYKDALGAAKRVDEKKLAFAGLAAVRTIESLQTVGSYLDDDALKAEAALAAAKIARPQNNSDKGLVDPDAAPILKKASVLIADTDVRKKLEEHIAGIPVPDAEGFVPLFNDKDLTGWEGDTKGYVVENAAIVCKPGGNLWTAKDYANFVVRFEFKLTPGANNGLGIRMAPRSHAAYQAMEIQILDDTDPQYKDLHPYQYHGSIYGVVPAEKGHLKPVGEWNDEEVTANGRQIIVKLNGATIVDADLDKASTPATMDGKAHPGLKNEMGRIGFLGHGTVVEFRNLRVKELR